MFEWILIFWTYGCTSIDIGCETEDLKLVKTESYSECVSDRDSWKLSDPKTHRAYCLPIDSYGYLAEYYTIEE